MEKLKQAIIVGTGSHSKSIISLIRRNKKYQIVGLLDLSKKFDINEKIMDISIIESFSNLQEIKNYKKYMFFIALGDNTLRKDVFNKMLEKDIDMPNLIDQNCYLDISAKCGKANIFFYNSYVGPLVEIGNNNIINTCSIVEHDAKIGNHCHLAPQSILCGNSMIQDLCFIGANSTVINNVEVSSNNLIGAGSTVTKNILKSSAKFVGSPAKEIKK